jgi:hypothetical protein
LHFALAFVAYAPLLALAVAIAHVRSRALAPALPLALALALAPALALALVLLLALALAHDVYTRCLFDVCPIVALSISVRCLVWLVSSMSSLVDSCLV